MQKDRINLEGKYLSYRIEGEGPAVVLLHGFGEKGNIWDRQYRAFPGYKLVIPDLPGSGDSDMTTDMSMEGLARSIHGLLNHLDIRRATLIGHSMGGYVTLAFAHLFEDFLSGFGLFHSTAYADSEEKIANRRKGIAFMQQHGALEFLKTSIPNLYSPRTRAEKPTLIEEQIADSHNFSASALVSYYEAMINRPDRTEVLKKSKIPVLFILGRHDVAVPIKDGLQLCHLPDLSYIHILENSGHMGMREEPERVCSLLTNYLNSIHHQTQ